MMIAVMMTRPVTVTPQTMMLIAAVTVVAMKMDVVNVVVGKTKAKAQAKNEAVVVAVNDTHQKMMMTLAMMGRHHLGVAVIVIIKVGRIRSGDESKQ